MNNEAIVSTFMLGAIFGIFLVAGIHWWNGEFDEEEEQKDPEISDLSQRTEDWLDWAKNVDRIDLAS